MAQKGGAVLSHIRIASSPDALHAPRLWAGSADLVLGCDLIVTASPQTLDMVSPDTAIVVNTEIVPTAQFQSNNAIKLDPEQQLQVLRGQVGDKVDGFNATSMATRLMGDSITTNMFMLGYAVQKGLVPLSIASLEEAIKLNGSQVKSTLQVFNWGRLAQADPAKLQEFLGRLGVQETSEPLSETLDQLIDRRVTHLTDYQSRAWADRYLEFVNKVRSAESSAVNGGDLPVTEAVARYLSKLMSYKDEYEVARLYTNGAFMDRLKQQFDGDFKIKFHMSPPVIMKPTKPGGEPRKIELGGWMLPVFRVMAKMKGLRGGALDVFGYNKERKMERRLIDEYRELIESVLPRLNGGNLDTVVKIAELPEMVRGYGVIKDRNVEQYEAEKARLLGELDFVPALAA